MRVQKFAILLIFSIIFSGLLFDTVSYARGRSKGKAVASRSKVAAGRSSKKVRVSSKRRGRMSEQRLASRRASARQRAQAARQAALARARNLDNSLLQKAQDQIQSDNTQGEDLEIRQAALNALGNHSGTVVVMDPRNGRVLSIVNQQWAVGKPFKPCSTIKLVTSIAALHEGLADPDYPLEFSGGGEMNMLTALAQSNNEYFQEIGEQLGTEQFVNYCYELGLGEPTGINIENESPGYLPQSTARNARIFSHGDDVGVTAMQLAVMVSAIANGGNIYQPQLPRTTEEAARFQPILVRKIDLPAAEREKIIEGMGGAVTYGTARRANIAGLNIVGKTGTCNGDTSRLGLFASFSNPLDPQLAVVVIATGSSEGGAKASAIAGEIYSQLASRLGSSEVKPVNADRPERPRRVNPLGQPANNSDTTLENFDDEEDDDRDDQQSN
jgi:penicillin-binding protein 2